MRGIREMSGRGGHEVSWFSRRKLAFDHLFECFPVKEFTHLNLKDYEKLRFQGPPIPLQDSLWRFSYRSLRSRSPSKLQLLNSSVACSLLRIDGLQPLIPIFSLSLRIKASQFAHSGLGRAKEENQLRWRSYNLGNFTFFWWNAHSSIKTRREQRYSETFRKRRTWLGDESTWRARRYKSQILWNSKDSWNQSQRIYSSLEIENDWADLIESIRRKQIWSQLRPIISIIWVVSA